MTFTTTPALATPPRRSPRARSSRDEAVLARIRRRGVDLCVWRRALPHLEASTTALAQADLQLDEVVEAARFSAARVVPDAALASEFDARVAWYARTLESPRVRFQLRAVDHQHCPRFHVDFVGVRLLCTYAGPGTEWIREDDLDRAQLGRSVTPLREGGRVRTLGRFDVAVLKGCAARDNRAFGVVHRSPPLVAGARRLVLTLDERP